MNIAICEDNAFDGEAVAGCVKSYCAKNFFDVRIRMFHNGEDLLAAFSPAAFELIFLDIFLPGLSGMDAARKIRETDPAVMLIFITASPDFALDGFLVDAASYVVKPVARERMESVLRRSFQHFARNSRVIEVPAGRQGRIGIPLSGVQYAEVYGRSVLFHLNSGVVETRLPLDEIEGMLGGEPFLRCHRCYIVNMNYVEDMRSEDFLMRNGDIVPMRKNGRKEVRMAMAGFMASCSIGVS